MPNVYIENVFAKPVNVLKEDRSVVVRVYLSEKWPSGNFGTLNIKLLDGTRRIANGGGRLTDDAVYEFTLSNLGQIELWDINNPKLYTVHVSVDNRDNNVDVFETRVGFREAKFTPEGFYLNGKHLKLRGLDRHQTFPFVGQAMPARVQKRDAWILRKELKCNIVRTSHYPQSPHFLDACDEYGLLVFEEIPGWQHIGDKDWQDLSVRHVEEMIRRDWHHPSIILWGVRVNESGDNHDFYTRTNKLAHDKCYWQTNPKTC